MMQHERLGSARTPCGGGIAQGRCERSAIRRTVAAFEIRRDIQSSGGSILPNAGDRPWLDEASVLLVKAAAALEQVDAQVPLAHLEQVIALVDDLRQAEARQVRTT